MRGLVLALLLQNPQAVYEGAVRDFEAGRFADSASGFDRLVALSPGSEPDLWQRGLAQYYAGQFKQCRAQFELHRAVNPADVENAAWHFLCVAAVEGKDKARASLLPVGDDARRPMREVYEMFQGRRSPDEVLAAGRGSLEGEFFSRLYAGLYLYASGETERAARLMAEAAQDRYKGGGYMHMVARVHRDHAARGAGGLPKPSPRDRKR